MCDAIKANEWSVHLFAVEVGARGYYAESVRWCLLQLGMPNAACKKLLKSLGNTSLRCSFEIWLSRENKEWSQPCNTSSVVRLKRVPCHELPNLPKKSARKPARKASTSSPAKMKANKAPLRLVIVA